MRFLGRGSYGEVKLVRGKKTGHLYALKTVSKDLLKRHYSLMMLLREINIHKSIKHPYIVELIDNFENDQSVFILLEYAAKGNLFNLIKNNRGLPEEKAWRYYTQTCVGLKYLHDRQIIHRDLKPENLLLDENDNVKICDFGWCVKSNEVRTTYCGTLDYMAPEMLLERGHSFQVDLWAMGVLLYELLHGYPPFKASDGKEKRRQILKTEISFADHIDENAKDLILKLIKFRPEERLSLNDVLTHPWIAKYARNPEYKVNQIVKHPEYGFGKIVDIKSLLCTIHYSEKNIYQYLTILDMHLTVDITLDNRFNSIEALIVSDKEKYLLESLYNWCNKPYKKRNGCKKKKSKKKIPKYSVPYDIRTTAGNSLLETEDTPNRIQMNDSFNFFKSECGNSDQGNLSIGSFYDNSPPSVKKSLPSREKPPLSRPKVPAKQAKENQSVNKTSALIPKESVKAPKENPFIHKSPEPSDKALKKKEEELKQLMATLEGRPSRKTREIISKKHEKEKKTGFTNWVSGLFGCGDR